VALIAQRNLRNDIGIDVSAALSFLDPGGIISSMGRDLFFSIFEQTGKRKLASFYLGVWCFSDPAYRVSFEGPLDFVI